MATLRPRYRPIKVERSPTHLDVVVNGRNLGKHIDVETLAGAARERGGVLLAWPRTGPVRIHR